MPLTFADFSSLPPAEQENFLDGPALPPPAGIVPNFENPPNRNILYRTVFGVFLTIMTITLFGRICTRYMMKQLFIGDYILILSYALTVANFAVCFRISATAGALVHQWDVRMRDLIPFLHLTFLTSSIYLVSLSLLKTSILLEWIRIFVPTGTRGLLFWASHFTIVVTTIFYAAMVISVNIACEPYEYNWNKLIRGNCHRVNTALTNPSTSIFNLITDVLILLIPQKAIWKLHMQTKKKIGVSIMFAIGLLGIAAATSRLVETVILTKSSDYTYETTLVSLSSSGEMTAGFLVICIPALPKAFSPTNMSKMRSSLRAWASREELRRSSEKSVESETAWPQSKGCQWNKYPGAHATQEREPNPVWQLQSAATTDQSFYDSSNGAEMGIFRITQFAISEGYDANATSTHHAYQRGLKGLPLNV